MKTCWEHREGFGPEHCERCAEAYDSEVTGCARCGAMVSNGAYFKRTSLHFKGTCKATKLWPIPASFLERKTMKPRSYDCLTGFMASSAIAEQEHQGHVRSQGPIHVYGMHGQPIPVGIPIQTDTVRHVEPDEFERIAQQLRLCALLAEQNELYRQIARKAA